MDVDQFQTLLQHISILSRIDEKISNIEQFLVANPVCPETEHSELHDNGVNPPAIDLTAENAQLRAEITKFNTWFQSLRFLPSRTSYGHMLISADDRVQCSRVIPEVNYEEHLLSEITAFLSKQLGFVCKTFLDIGSNIGTQSVYMLKTGLAGRAIAIEPDPTNYKILRANFILNDVDDRAIALNSALGDFDGEVEFELSKDNMGDHRVRLREFEGWVQNEQHRDVIKVQMLCPKTALENYRLNYETTLVWLDAQGLEGHILTSFIESKEHIRYFVCEYWPYGIECAGGRSKLFEIFERCEEIYDIRNMSVGGELSVDYLKTYYEESILNEANHKVFSIDLLCVMKR